MNFDPRWKLPQGRTLEAFYDWAFNLVRELRAGTYLPSAVTSLAADAITYDNATSGLAADDVQDAIDEVEDRVDTLEAAPTLGLALLASGTVTNQATLDIDLTAFTAYRAIKIVLSGFVPATDDVELWMRFSTDGGSNFDAGASDYAWLQNRGRSGTSASSTDLDTADAAIAVAGIRSNGFSVSNDAGESGVSAVVEMFNRTDAALRTLVSSLAGYIAENGEFVSQAGHGWRLAAQDTDAVRLLFETGNIKSGNYAVYGYN